MEVHAHTPDPDPSTSSGHRGRKKWTHYLWEFLMLFLAVFCGFLAENLREHKIERDKEKEFMKSMLYDLQRDSLFLYNNVKTGPRTILYSDSLISELKKQPLQGRENRIHYFLCLVTEGLDFRYYDRTVSQLRNAGGFRLLRKTEVSNAIMDYDVLMREAQGYSTSAESWSFISPGLKKSAAIFDIDLVFRLYDSVRAHIGHIDSIYFPPGLKLITYEDKDIREFINLQQYGNLTDVVKLNYSQIAFRKNRIVDSIIRKEYYLK